MRDMLFRGKRVDNGEWVEGSLILTTSVKEKAYIVDSCYCYDGCIDEDGYADFDRLNAFEVITESVGQFTGLYDKSHTKIFEGDFIKNEYGRLEVVEYCKGFFYPFVAFPEYKSWRAEECEVGGNEFDFSYTF